MLIITGFMNLHSCSGFSILVEFTTHQYTYSIYDLSCVFRAVLDWSIVQKISMGLFLYLQLKHGLVKPFTISIVTSTEYRGLAIGGNAEDQVTKLELSICAVEENITVFKLNHQCFMTYYSEKR